MISSLIMLMACGGKKAQTESSEAANNDSTAILAQEEMTGLIKELYAAEAKNEEGIDQLYACHTWRKMVAAVEEKDSHVAEVGQRSASSFIVLFRTSVRSLSSATRMATGAYTISSDTSRMLTVKRRNPT